MNNAMTQIKSPRSPYPTMHPPQANFRYFYTTAVAIISLSVGSLILSAAPIQVENQWIKAEFDPGTSTYSIKDSSGETVFGNGVIQDAGSNAKISQVKDSNFGEGSRIETGKATITLYKSLPFALIQSSMDPVQHVPGQTIPPKTITLTSGVANPGQPLSKFKIIGTGGEMKPKEGVDVTTAPASLVKPVVDDKNENTDQSSKYQPSAKPGSYAWAVVGDPKTRKGLVMAWLTHDKSVGLVFASLSKGSLTLEARAEYGRYAPKSAVPTETLVIGYFDDIRLGLEAWADAVAKYYGVHLPKQMSGYSSNSVGGGHGIAGLEKETAEVAKFAGRELKPFGLKYLQMDDGWQLTKRDFSTHDPKGPYPDGMKLTADRIREAGLIPGLWAVPFVGNGKDMSIIAKTPEGVPFKARWSGFCLDLTIPKAVEFMQDMVRRITKDWGYGFLKLDGFHAGTATENIYVNAAYGDTTIGRVQLADPSISQIEAFRNGIRALRETVGPNIFLLGCAVTQNMVSYAGSFGLVDAMRVGPDNAGDWGHWAGKSPIFGTRHYFENRRIWYVDPDMAYARNSMTLDQARTSCSWTAISGQLFTASDWLPDLTPDRLDILKRTMEPHHGIARPVDFFEHPASSIWLVSDKEPNPTRQIVAFFDVVPYKRVIGDSLERIGLDPAKEYYGFDFWGNKLLGPFKDRIETTLNANQCLILSVLPTSDHPRLISTSRHVTQGMVDCLEETWDTKSRVMQCRNRLIGGDPCEMRIVLPDAGWKAGDIKLSSEDAEAGVTAGKVSQEGNLLRVSITPPITRDVTWSLKFN